MSKRGKASERGEKKTKVKAPGVAKGNGEVAARDGLPAGYWKACELARERAV